MTGRKKMWIIIIIGIIAGIVIITAIVVPLIIFLPRETDKTATTSQEISSTTKGR